MTQSTEIQTPYYEEASSWHDDMFNAKESQISLYRNICIGLFALLSIALIALTSLITRETVQPFLAMVDKRTGEVTTPIRFNNSSTQVSWNMVRHFVTRYINDRESYNFLNINEPYQTVIAMSDKQVLDQVNQYIRPELNDNSPIKILGQHHYITVTIHSIAKLSSEHLLDVRFTTNTINSENNQIEKTNEWRTTMKWDLVNKSRSLAEWDKNPLGFTINFYDKQPVV